MEKIELKGHYESRGSGVNNFFVVELVVDGYGYDSIAFLSRNNGSRVGNRGELTIEQAYQIAYETWKKEFPSLKAPHAS